MNQVILDLVPSHPSISLSVMLSYSAERTAKKVKRLLKDINLHHKRRLTEFRFTQDSDYIRHKFLNLISKQDIEVGQVVVKKTAVRQHLRDSTYI
jgi:hypothetical protein